MGNIVLLIPILGVMCGVLAVIGGVFVKPWLAYRQRRLEIEASMIAEKAAQYAAQTERLEQRMRVIERIVTDRGIDLADEIEALRHVEGREDRAPFPRDTGGSDRWN